MLLGHPQPGRQAHFFGEVEQAGVERLSPDHQKFHIEIPSA